MSKGNYKQNMNVLYENYNCREFIKAPEAQFTGKGLGFRISY